MTKPACLAVPRRNAVILRSKLTPPGDVRNTEPRPRLLESIRDIAATALLFIQAPAGYGKTTLLKQFHRQLHNTGKQVAWLTLYHTENESVRAFAHITAAFGVLGPEVKREMTPYFSATPPYPIEDIIASLIHCLERFNSGVTLILDDFHEITDPDVQNAFSYFLNNLPLYVHCIIASRNSLPRAMKRLHVQGSVVTLSRDDLRFNRDETARYLKNTSNFDLSSENLDAFSAQTEGWITAMKLAVLSMPEQGGEMSVRKWVSGSHEALVDYLTEAVLNKHDEETRRFLLQTAPLGRLTADLCNAVTGRDDADEQLTKLARENLFINAQDKRGKWYCFHSLFSEFLCGLLTREPDYDRARIHRRASQWYKENGMPVEAVEQAIESGDTRFAAEVIAPAVQRMIRAGQVTRLLSWLNQLPKSTLSQSPNLLSHLFWSQYLAHKIPEAKQTVRMAEKLYQQNLDALNNDDRRRVPEYLAELGVINQAINRIATEDWSDAKPMLDLKVSLHSDWVFIRSVLEVELGYIYLHQDKLENAYAAFQDAYAYGQAVPNALVVNLSSHMLASIRWLQGRLNECEHLCREGIANAIDEHRQPLPVAGKFHLLLARIHYETNTLKACREHLEKSIALIALSSDPELLTETELLAAKLLGLERGPREVVNRLYDAERLVSRRGTPLLLSRIRAHQIWSLIDCRDFAAAEAILRQCEMPVDKPSPPPSFKASPENEFFYLALCRYWVAAGYYKQAGSWLRQLLRNAESSGRTMSVVLISGLLAILAASQGRPEAGARLLRDVAVIATERHFARSVIDLGVDFTRLLEDYYRLRTTVEKTNALQPTTAYIYQLLEITRGGGSPVSAFGVDPAVSPANSAFQSGETLTPRELQILEQIARGKKNREVADELLIAESSVRWHIKNLYIKLDVHNRTEASAKARDLKILR